VWKYRAALGAAERTAHARVKTPSSGHAGGNGNGHSGVVRRAVRVPWQEYDLRGLASTEARTSINSYLETDRSRRRKEHPRWPANEADECFPVVGLWS
jgi:hypothetical protein